tara:strand:+ start:22708 stop:24378 length:1671 start_codon:yes stop_codon:yes gene_type:complete
MTKKTYGKIHYDDSHDEWVITQMLPHVKIKLKSIFTRIGKTAQPPYKIKNTLNFASDIHWFIQRYPLEISPKDSRRLTRRKNKAEKLNNEIQALTTPDSFPSVNATLKGTYAFRPHQARNVALHDRVKRLLVGDKVGKGKTLSCLGTIFNNEHIPYAIVVEPHLQQQWMEKIAEFTHLEAHAITGTRPYDLPKAQIYVFRYSQLSGWADVFAEGIFKAVAFDEIQNLRTGTGTGKGSAAKILTDHAEAVLGLSATPIYGYGVEIWNIMNFINPDILGDLSSFVREWCPDGKTVTDPDALGEYLRECNVFIRYVGEDDEPEPNIYVENVPHDMDAVKSAEQLAASLALTALTGSYLERGDASRQLDLKLREMTGISKAKYVAHFVRMIAESGEKVLLAGWHREVYRIWQRELNDLGVVMYTGSESPSQKERSKKEFMEGDAKIMIISLRSGSGLDGIQAAASHVVFGELDWSGEVHKQVIGRLDREGQKEQVTAVFCVTDYGSDPVIQSLIGLKRSQSSGIVDPGKLQVINNTDPQRVKTLAREYLKSRGMKVPEAA